MVRPPSSSSQLSTDQIRAFGQVLARTEWLSAEELQSYQAPLVSRLLLHARKTTRFYRDRIDRDLSSIQRIREAWSEIPILTRAEAVKNRLKLFSRKPPPIAGSVIEGATSGSTGAPFAFKKSALSEAASIALTERLYRWWSVNGEKSLALIAPGRGIAPPPDGLTTHGWQSSHTRGVRHLISLDADIDRTWVGS